MLTRKGRTGWNVMESPSQVAPKHAHDHRESVSDSILVEQLRNGCADCFSIIFYRYCHIVFRIAWKVLRDQGEAEDIVQDLFLAIYQQRQKYDLHRGSVKTWILHTVHFKALSRRRQLKCGILDSIQQGDSLEESLRESPLHREEDIDRTRLVERGLSVLKERQRRAIELIHLDGYTLLETSDILGESLPNTRNLYYRGMKALREALLQSRMSSKPEMATEARESLLLGANQSFLVN
jgi:RNA polymerase sigma-70 factor, ECF subfamily